MVEMKLKKKKIGLLLSFLGLYEDDEDQEEQEK